MKYPILLAFDNNYSKYSIVLIKNIVNMSNNRNDITFIIIIDETVNFEFQTKYLKNEKINFKTFVINSNEFNDLMVSGHITKGAYYLFKGLDILKDNCEYLLYLDIDIYVKIPIENLFKMISINHSLTVPSYSSDYFGSGLFLVNFSLFKEKFSMSNFMEIYQSNKENIKWHDQDILNLAFENDWKQISILYDYNAQDWKFDKRKLKSKGLSIKDSKIIHFPGTSKPWRFSTVLPYVKEWNDIFFNIYNRKPWDTVSFNDLMKKFVFTIFPDTRIILNLYIKIFRKKQKNG